MRLDPELPPWVRALFAQPRHAGRPRTGRFQHGTGGAIKSGNLLEIWLAIRDQQIAEARFEAFGCPSTIACGEWLCAWLPGRTVSAAERLTGLELAEALELEPVKRSVALVAEDALKAALVAPAQDIDDDAEDRNHGA